ncbi:MAG: hypothetical protein H6Q33_5220 [Deltaproteobacteria bacterium]|nr:hypothetical protein [Deltaproteobacteria bacterium]
MKGVTAEIARRAGLVAVCFSNDDWLRRSTLWTWAVRE